MFDWNIIILYHILSDLSFIITYFPQISLNYKNFNFLKYKNVSFLLKKIYIVSKWKSYIITISQRIINNQYVIEYLSIFSIFKKTLSFRE